MIDGKSEFRNFYILLSQDKWFKKIFDTSQLEALVGKSKHTSSDIWEYSTSRLIFRKIDLQRHVRPEAIKPDDDATLELEVGFNGQYSVLTNKIYDHIKSLAVRITINLESIDEDLVVIERNCLWHLDKHDYTKAVNSSHPLYHFEFGGSSKTETEGFSYGHFILLDTPRIMHPPLDIVLAIDFVLKHFYPYSQSKSLTDKAQYKEIIKNAQYRMWRPYFLSVVSEFHDFDTQYEFDKRFTQNIFEC